ncbi:MAG: 23S rRNA (adenine(2503)-C(2))-methyltransferase RlmN [Rikenellaceae bacterium]
MVEAKSALYGMSLSELDRLCAELGMPKFAAKQIANWLYIKQVGEISQMTNLSQSSRALLSRSYRVGRSAPIHESVAEDGTKKYLFATEDENFIESAYIPDAERATLCISSQVGCRMGCKFCATARQGLVRSLTAGEILNQFASLPEHDGLTNIVFMGMGEPLDNIDNLLKALEVLTAEWGYAWSPSRITVSTAGVIPALKRLLDESSVHIAISLHNPYSDERREIMPIERAYPIADVMELLRGYDFTRQRRLSFEYILMSGMNNSPHHIREICRLLDGVKARLNIIRFHKIPSSPYFSPPMEKMTTFRDTLTAKGIHTTIRRSRGEDIEAACGMLSTKAQSGKICDREDN